MFYAVVLWYCARQMNGAVLLGQSASVGLLLWLGYQTLLLRRQTTHPAQQTPIRLGKTERKPSGSRPLIKDYEFVEDGVEDAVDQEPDPDSPILIQPAKDVAPTMVVPAAIPKPVSDDSVQEPRVEPTEPKVKETPKETSAAKTAFQQNKLNPIATVGIFVGWFREVVTPKKKEPQPMIELPPRPPSIPKSVGDIESATGQSLETVSTAQGKSHDPSKSESTATVKTTDTVPTSTGETRSPKSEVVIPPAPSPTATSTPPSNEEEESNWPEDAFWE